MLRRASGEGACSPESLDGSEYRSAVSAVSKSGEPGCGGPPRRRALGLAFPDVDLNDHPAKPNMDAHRAVQAVR